MNKWEYRVAEFGRIDLDKLGQDGWELVAVRETDHQMIFKRPAEQKKPTPPPPQLVEVKPGSVFFNIVNGSIQIAMDRAQISMVDVAIFNNIPFTIKINPDL